ncbi:MAG: sulfatase [Candidatus Daviesbacteria bacterium]|nr:sulfatase [Candidatus Daviesbacteria bacterium]
MQKKPNVVLITIDSLRADFCGFLNPKEKNTPFLDSIANKSYIFTSAISPANPTFFVFSSIMTGVLPFTYGKYLGIPDNPNIKTLAEIMKANDYNTFAFLADSPALYSIYGYQKGFDHYDDGYENTDKTYLSSLVFLWDLREKMPEKLLRIIETVRTFIKVVFFSPKHSVPGKKLNEKVMDFFEQRKNKPFFLWLHYMDNHVPYFSGLDKYFFKNQNLIKRIFKKIIFYKELATSLRKMKLKNHKTNEIFQEAYRSSVKYSDEYTGKIISYLRRKYPNTVFIITSDHGESFMEHGLYGHEAYSLYNESIQIPLIIHIPSKKPQLITQTVSLVSIAKTIAAIAGLEVSQFKGDNLLTDKVFSPINNISQILYKCRSPHVRLGILDNNTEIQGYNSLWSFTTPEEKYIFEENGKEEKYYNLLNDPGENKNLLRNKTADRRIKKIKSIIENAIYLK